MIPLIDRVVHQRVKSSPVHTSCHLRTVYQDPSSAAFISILFPKKDWPARPVQAHDNVTPLDAGLSDPAQTLPCCGEHGVNINLFDPWRPLHSLNTSDVWHVGELRTDIAEEILAATHVNAAITKIHTPVPSPAFRPHIRNLVIPFPAYMEVPIDDPDSVVS